MGSLRLLHPPSVPGDAARFVDRQCRGREQGGDGSCGVEQELDPHPVEFGAGQGSPCRRIRHSIGDLHQKERGDQGQGELCTGLIEVPVELPPRALEPPFEEFTRTVDERDQALLLLTAAALLSRPVRWPSLPVRASQHTCLVRFLHRADASRSREHLLSVLVNIATWLCRRERAAVVHHFRRHHARPLFELRARPCCGVLRPSLRPEHPCVRDVRPGEARSAGRTFEILPILQSHLMSPFRYNA
ncbi:hypothetical protein M2271_008480 [Streptomyces sp. LBL]|nr:hypothetical protein [Streptomyces sp. LBL]